MRTEATKGRVARRGLTEGPSACFGRVFSGFGGKGWRGHVARKHESAWRKDL